MKLRRGQSESLLLSRPDKGTNKALFQTKTIVPGL